MNVFFLVGFLGESVVRCGKGANGPLFAVLFVSMGVVAVSNASGIFTGRVGNFRELDLSESNSIRDTNGTGPEFAFVSMDP